ncbi:MAG: 50S ribosomal protein L33 [Myxococcota bacterium]
MNTSKNTRPPRREKVSLVCVQCKARNYRTTRRREQRVSRSKFCRTCDAHTLHRAAR